MKKTYMNPEITIVNVELQNICEASIPVGEDYAGGDVLSRDNFDIWGIEN